MAAWPGKHRRWVVLSDGGDLARLLEPAIAASGERRSRSVKITGMARRRDFGGLDQEQPWWPGRVEADECPMVDIIHLGSLATNRHADSLPDLASREAFVILQAAAGPQIGAFRS